MTTYRLSLNLTATAEQADMFMAALASYLEEDGAEVRTPSVRRLGSVCNVAMYFSAPDDATAIALYGDAVRGAGYGVLGRDSERLSVGRGRERRTLILDDVALVRR